MTERLVVSDITEKHDGVCENCESSNADRWIHGSHKTVCANCCFNVYNVEYELYLDTVLNARKKSIQKADESGEPAELIGQCHRNSAVLASDLNNNHSIPKDHIVIVLGYFNDNVKGEIRHYWVGIQSSSTPTIHIDPVVPVENDGIWVDKTVPSSYTVEAEVPLTEYYKLPSEVQKWVSV